MRHDYTDIVTAANRLNRTDLSFEYGGLKFETYWCRFVLDRCEKWNYKSHSHTFLEIQLVLSGMCRFNIKGNDTVLKKGEFIIIPQKYRHAFVSTQPDFIKFVLGVSVEPSGGTVNAPLTEFFDAISQISVMKYTGEIEDIIHIIYENALNKRYNSSEVLKSQLFCFFTALEHCYLKGVYTDESQNSFKSNYNYVLVEHVKKFIHDNISNHIDNEDIASQFQMSERQLRRIVSDVCGTTLFELRKNIQIDEVKRLMHNSALSLEEISEKCSFSDVYSMSKAFKRAEGMPPGQYRKAINKTIDVRK